MRVCECVCVCVNVCACVMTSAGLKPRLIVSHFISCVCENRLSNLIKDSSLQIMGKKKVTSGEPYFVDHFWNFLRNLIRLSLH